MPAYMSFQTTNNAMVGLQLHCLLPRTSKLFQPQHNGCVRIKRSAANYSGKTNHTLLQNPKGIPQQSPGLLGHELPWVCVKRILRPQRGRAMLAHNRNAIVAAIFLAAPKPTSYNQCWTEHPNK